MAVFEGVLSFLIINHTFYEAMKALSLNKADYMDGVFKLGRLFFPKIIAKWNSKCYNKQ
ncbi:MAG: hypothetical protein ACMG6E_06035 [Candidatus Roizmanbacteria bacterium]